MRAATCWCGSTDLEEFSTEYGVCSACGTLVYRVPYDPEEFVDGTGFYGEGYWQKHVPEVDALPGLEDRAETDLSDRAAIHLGRVLDYCKPGLALLEVGCGHGGLTYLLGCAGLRAEGLEIGRPALETGTARFGITVHEGPLERRDDLPRYDAVLAIDLFEHLPHPRATLASCHRHLEEDGLLFLQTPRFEGHDPAWSMLIPEEHLFLYTESSIQALLELEGFSVLRIDPSLFEHDMWVVASKGKVGPSPGRTQDDTPPEIRALICAVKERLEVEEKLSRARTDQREKEALIEGLSARLGEMEQDQAAKETLIGRISAELAEARDDQAAKDALTERVSAEITEVRNDQATKEAMIERVSAELTEVRTDQATKSALIEQLSAELAEVRNDQVKKQALIEQLSAELAEVRDDQAKKQALIERLSGPGEIPEAHGSERNGPADHDDDRA